MRTTVLGFAALLLATLTARGSLALANPIDRGPTMEGPEVRVVNAAAGVPENGFLLILGAYDEVPMVVVTRIATNEPLEGTVTAVEGSRYWTWQPAQPFVVHESYDVQIGTVSLGFPWFWEDIAVVPAIELTKPDLMSAPSASSISMISNTECCRARAGNTEFLTSTDVCFGVENETWIRLDPGLSTASPALLINQFLFRFDTAGAERSFFVHAALSEVVLPLVGEQADEYCFELTAIELPARIEHTYEDLDTCADHGAVGQLGAAPVELGAAELTRSSCPAPPAGFEEAWCDVNASCADEDEPDPQCELYPHVCEGEPLVMLDSGVTATDPRPDAGHASSSDPPSDSRDGDGGCSVATVATSRNTRVPLGCLAPALAVLAIAFRRRAAVRFRPDPGLIATQSCL